MAFISKKKIRRSLAIFTPIILIPGFFRDYYRYIKYSGVMGTSKKEQLIGLIIASYHVVEKGLTMPETRLGFGQENLESLISLCKRFIKKFGDTDSQLKHAVSVILEYRDFHKKNNFELNANLLDRINELESLVDEIPVSHQEFFTKDDFFSNINQPFNVFSDSRKSIRNYSSDTISSEIIKQAVKMAQNAPSACNRQTAKVHVVSESEKVQEVLRLQAANRGFGHLADKVIIVTCELGVFHGLRERNAGFVDGGIFAMNLLYALHFHKIVACTLNCSLSIKTEKRLKELCNIKKSESLVLMICCGMAQDTFKSALSTRYPVDDILFFD